MIQVSKSEMKYLRECIPGIQATRTVNKYYVEETLRVLSVLKAMWSPKEHKNA